MLTPRIRRVAVIGNHTPRQCGIGTFTADVIDSLAARYPELDCFGVAMNDRPEGYVYPPQVRYEIQADDLMSYQAAAVALNASEVDVVCLQHEYGIFGGAAGSHILTLLRELKMPIVTTLHTILSKPNPDQCAVMAQLTRLSDRLIVMSQRGAQLLQDVHGVSPSKIEMIHHGIPATAPESSAFYKQQLGLADHAVLLTFGLLSPDKGIENVIEALPAVVARFPNVIYVVLGATHPHVRNGHGEEYRESLTALAEVLGVRDNVHFHNHFVPLEALTHYLRAADIYITPYLKPEQITSGALAYAVGSGNAVISTPYSYAEELLADERGVLVPWRDPSAIANAVNGLLSDPKALSAMQRRAAMFGRQMLWPAVAARYHEVFTEAMDDSLVSARLRRSVKMPLPPSQPALPPLNLAHLRLMTDDTGLLQHATYNIPNCDEGYCLDDNVRALLLTTFLESHGETEVLLATRYLSFVNHAWNPETGRFRNFLSYNRQWLEAQGSEDSHGRALWVLGTVAARSQNPGWRRLAGELFRGALPVVAQFTSPRAWAYTLLGIDSALDAMPEQGALPASRWMLTTRLMTQFKANSTLDWPWLEDRATYANARLAQALIVSGRRMGDSAMLTVGLRALDWLSAVQQTKEGYFAPIGSNGFLQRGQLPARFDQQPIEACGMISACRDAYLATGDERWQEQAQRAFAWFLGQNELHQPLYDPLTGRCCDGLHPERINENQGAESTLSFLQARVEMDFASIAATAWSPANKYQPIRHR